MLCDGIYQFLPLFYLKTEMYSVNLGEVYVLLPGLRSVFVGDQLKEKVNFRNFKEK